MNSVPLLRSSMQPFQGLSVQASSTSGLPRDLANQRRTSVDWDEMMRGLMRGLEQICGSKGRDPHRRSAQLDFIMSPAVSNPPSPTRFSQELQCPEGDHHGKGVVNGHSHFRRHSDELPHRNRGQKMIFVRHIETHEELNSRLIEICRQRSLSEVERTPRTSGEMRGAARSALNSALVSKCGQRAVEMKDNDRPVNTHQRRVRFQFGDDEGGIHLKVGKDQRSIGLHSQRDQREIRFEGPEDQRDIKDIADDDERNLRLHSGQEQRDFDLDKDNQGQGIDISQEADDQRKLGLSVESDQLDQPIQVEVGSRNIEDLVVAVRDHRHLTVESISAFGDSVLYDSTLPHDLTSGSLLCHLTGNGLLHIRHQSPSLAGERFVGTGSTFIPIIRRNEASLELTVVLHIPEDFRFDDVVVRTVDNQLVVIGRKRSLSLPAIDGDASTLCSRDALRPPSFRVYVQLPREVNCRSVNASLTEDHQLIVKGEIDPLPRRYSL